MQLAAHVLLLKVLKFVVRTVAYFYRIYTNFIQPSTTFFAVYFAWVQKTLLYEEQNFKLYKFKTTKKPLNFYAGVLFFTDPDTETVHDNMYQIIVELVGVVELT